MQQLIICRGLPGAGKSTFAKAWVLELPHKRIRVCRDDIRRMLGPYWMPTREDLVTSIERYTVRKSLETGYSVVVDATNFKDPWPQLIRVMFELGNFSAELSYKDFTHIPIETCIAQDLMRPKAEQVGEAVIRGMFNRYLKHHEPNLVR